MRWICFLLLASCGPAASRPLTPAESEAMQAGDPTDHGSRRAELGSRCDFGGSADFTCHIGLQCCYGEGDDYGTCQRSCE